MKLKAGAWRGLGLGLAALAFAAPSRAQYSGAGTSGDVFLKTGIGSPTAMALGRSYVALAEGVEAMTWNPAGVALAGERELETGVMSYLQNYSGEYMGYVQPLGRTVVGVNMAYASMGNFDVRDANGLALDNSTTFYRTGFATITFARSFFLERLFLGISGKAVYQDLAGENTTNFVGDVGILYKPNPRLAFGAALQNFLNDSSQVVQTSRLGAAFTPVEYLQISIETSKDSDEAQRIGIGTAFILPQDLLQVGACEFRIGYYSSDSYGQGFDSSQQRFGINLSEASGISYGIGLSSTRLVGYGISLDYAFVPYGALGEANIFNIKVTF